MSTPRFMEELARDIDRVSWADVVSALYDAAERITDLEKAVEETCYRLRNANEDENALDLASDAASILERVL